MTYLSNEVNKHFEDKLKEVELASSFASDVWKNMVVAVIAIDIHSEELP